MRNRVYFFPQKMLIVCRSVIKTIKLYFGLQERMYDATLGIRMLQSLSIDVCKAPSAFLNKFGRGLCLYRSCCLVLPVKFVFKFRNKLLQLIFCWTILRHQYSECDFLSSLDVSRMTKNTFTSRSTLHKIIEEVDNLNQSDFIKIEWEYW